MAATFAWRSGSSNGGSHGATDMEKNMYSKVQESEPPTPHSVMRGSRDRSSIEDTDGTLSNVAQCIEQLRQSTSSPQEKEFTLKRLLNLIDTREKAFSAVGSHSQAVPTLVSLLRSGSFGVKLQAAIVLDSLCREGELRVKVLLGGCIPPLLSLLKSSSPEGQFAAAKTIYAVSQGGARDHVGSKIFSTEGVVPVLWGQLLSGLKVGSTVDHLLTGALRSLSCCVDGFWLVTKEVGGVDVLIKLLTTGESDLKKRTTRESDTLANVCSLLASMMMADASTCKIVLSASATKLLLKLLGPGNEAPVRAEAAGALKSLSAQCKEAKREIAAANGISGLINATIAPSKEYMQGEHAQALQEHAMCALANISGGLSYVISSLGESLESCSSATQIADTLGALASALMIYDSKSESIRASEPLVIEQMLIKQFKSNLPFLVMERIIESLASLYGNDVLSRPLINSDAKRLLVGLITMASDEIQHELISSLLILCKNGGSLWQALQGRDGVQLLISLLGLSSEQQQECAVALLSFMSDENDESKWAITAAGGIPPLVQILETGSAKAKEDSAKILGNLCNHSEDIRACVESADAVPALLWLLKNGSNDGKEIAAKTLNHLINKSDTGTISQLSALLLSEQPESKVYILEALQSLLSAAPLTDLLRNGSASNDAIETMIEILSSTKEETQAKSASALAGLFRCRKDLRESRFAVRALSSAMKLLDVDSELVVMGSASCLASIFLSIRQNRDVAALAKGCFVPLVLLAKSLVLEVAEQAMRALANLLLDSDVSLQASAEDIVPSVRRILHDGSLDGRLHAASAIARILKSRTSDISLSNSLQSAGVVLSIVSLLEVADIEAIGTSDTLDALVLLLKLKGTGSAIKPPAATLAENPQTILPLVSCAACSMPAVQDKAIEVLSRLSCEQASVIGSTVASISGGISSVARRIISSSMAKIKVGGSALLICAARENNQMTIDTLNESNLMSPIIHSLVGIIGSMSSSLDHMDIRSEDISIVRSSKGSKRLGDDTASVISGGTIVIWLLSLLACHDRKSRITLMEAGAVGLLTNKISQHISLVAQSISKEGSFTWACALLLAIMFQDREIATESETMRAIPVLASLLRLEESANRYFAAQALCSLVCQANGGMLLSIANAGTAGGLIHILGCSDSDIADMLELAEEFCLVSYPEQVALERMFRVDDIKVSATSRKAIPALVDLLKPIPDRPGAPFLALQLLTQLAVDCPGNKVLMVEAGALEALTKYLSLGVQDATEEATAALLGILFDSTDIRRHESACGAVNQLVAVLRLGGRNSRYSASKALECLFSAEHIKNSESARHAVQPLVEILNIGLEREQHAAISALIRLLHDNPSRALVGADVESSAIDVLRRILSSNCSLELMGDVAELCCVLFGNIRIRTTMAAARCVEPLVSLIEAEDSPAQHAAVRALDMLLEDAQLAEKVFTHGAVAPLIGLLVGKKYSLHEAASRALAKLGRDRPVCKIDMVKAGVISNILVILPQAPNFLCIAFADLLRILTNNASIAKGPSVAKLIDPIFSLLTKTDLDPEGQHSALQVLINIFEHPQCRATYKLTPQEALGPVIALLGSSARAVQQLAAELLSYLLLKEHLQKDAMTQQAIGPLIHLLGSGAYILQQRAIKALASIAVTWPNAIAKENGVSELSKVILQSDPPLHHALWESAASVLSIIFQFSSEFFLEVPIAVLVRLLHSGSESTVAGALNALLVLESDDSTSAESMTEAGILEALVELLRAHQCEETAARLLETLLNNTKIRDTKAARAVITPLSLYLLDHQTQSQQGRLLSALALGDLFQNEGFIRCGDALSACRALVNLLFDQPTEEMKVVALCTLQNLVKGSRANRRAVAESNGVPVVLEIISSSVPETSIQAAMFLTLLFSNNTIQEYASSETVRVITASIERELLANGIASEEYLKALNALLGNLPRLRATEPATLSIPHLITALKTGSEACQEAALDSLYLLRQAWTACPPEVFKAQLVAAAEAIPFLQYLIQSGPPRFQEKAELLLQCLPGTLHVIIKRGSNLKQSVGNPSVYCKLTLGHTTPRLTKISTGSSPEWDESFAWEFDSPPRGQKLHISCKNKSKFSKAKFGKVTIPIERAVMLGSHANEYTLLPVGKSGPRKLEIEFQWSNKHPN